VSTANTKKRTRGHQNFAPKKQNAPSVRIVPTRAAAEASPLSDDSRHSYAGVAYLNSCYKVESADCSEVFTSCTVWTVDARSL